MSTSVHNPDRYMFDFRQLISNGRKKIGILIGAGAPVSINVSTDDTYRPLIPNIEGLTQIVRESLDIIDSEIYDTLSKRINTTNLERILSDVRTLAEIIGDNEAYGGNSDSFKKLEKSICESIKKLLASHFLKLKTPIAN